MSVRKCNTKHVVKAVQSCTAIEKNKEASGGKLVVSGTLYKKLGRISERFIWPGMTMLSKWYYY